MLLYLRPPSWHTCKRHCIQQCQNETLRHGKCQVFYLIYLPFILMHAQVKAGIVTKIMTVLILCAVMETIGKGIFPVHIESPLMMNDTSLQSFPTFTTTTLP